MIWEFNGYGGIVAIREGKWKAVRRHLKRKNKEGNWELYDLVADPEESNDLAKKHPERVQKLEMKWLDTRTVELDFPVPMVDEK